MSEGRRVGICPRNIARARTGIIVPSPLSVLDKCEMRLGGRPSTDGSHGLGTVRDLRRRRPNSTVQRICRQGYHRSLSGPVVLTDA